MKIVTTYIAFDDTEFDTEKECLEYENRAVGYIAEILRCYTFYNENMDVMVYGWSNDIIETLECIEKMYDECECIKVHKTVSREAYEFLRNTEGIFLPVDVGMYTYDYSTGKWI